MTRWCGALVLLTDGETTVGRPAEVGAQEAADAGVPVFTIAFGTPGGTITDPTSGEVVPLPVQPAPLEQVAEVTGGKAYEDASSGELQDADGLIRESLGDTLGEEIQVVTELTWRWAAIALVLRAAAWALALWCSATWSDRLDIAFDSPRLALVDAPRQYSGAVPGPFLPPLVRDLPADVLRVRLPTPFAVGAVNCYVLLGPPVTVVDPGTVIPASLERLGAALAGAGCSLDDVEQVVVTHAHPDHFGAAAWVARRSGSVILAGRAEVAALRGGQGGERRSAMMTALGVPVDLVGAAAAAATRMGDVVEWADGVTIVPVDDGDVVHAGGRVLTAYVTAGHAPGHLSLWSDGAKLLMSGDHLLARIVPLAGLEPSGARTGHRHSLDEYLSSLQRFVALDPAVVLPGHGEAFTGVDVLARRLRAHHADRCAAVRVVVAELGRPTPYDVAQRLLWQAEGSRLLRGVAEVVGHLDLLEQDGDVVAEAEGPVLRYRAAV